MEDLNIIIDYDPFGERSVGHQIIQSRPPIDNMMSFIEIQTGHLFHVFSRAHANKFKKAKTANGSPRFKECTNSFFIGQGTLLSDTFFENFRIFLDPQDLEDNMEVDVSNGKKLFSFDY